MSLIVFSNIANAANECPWPGYVKDANGNCYLPTKDTGGESLKERCLNDPRIPQKYKEICCNPPDYAASSACQDALNGQSTAAETQRTLEVGGTWNLDNGWTLTAQSIDAKASPRQVWLSLSKDSVQKDDKVVAQGQVYTYVEGGTRIVISVGSISAGATSDMVQLSLKEPIRTVPTQKPVEESLPAKIVTLEKQAIPITPEQVLDFDGKAVSPEKLKTGLGDSLPVAQMKFTLKNLKDGQTVSTDLPEGMPLEKIILTSSGTVTDTTVTVTVVDGTKPQLLGVGAPDTPEPRRYELKNYFKVDAVVNEEESHPFKDALFKYFIKGITEDDSKHAKLLRYDAVKKDWTPLPTEKVGRCEFNSCEFVSESTGNSYFAVVVEKTQATTAATAGTTQKSEGFEIIMAVTILLAVYSFERNRKIK